MYSLKIINFIGIFGFIWGRCRFFFSLVTSMPTMSIPKSLTATTHWVDEIINLSHSSSKACRGYDHPLILFRRRDDVHINCSQPNGWAEILELWAPGVIDSVAVALEKTISQMLVQNKAVLRRRGHTWSTATWKILHASGLHKPPSQTSNCLHRRSNLHRHLFRWSSCFQHPNGSLSLKCFGIRGIEILPKLYRYKVLWVFLWQ